MNAIPNIFDFATSELSQDAALAYILSWADPQFSESHAALNELGENLLRALVASAAAAMSKPDLLEGVAIESVKARTQRERIDVVVEINDTVFLIIEDKTGTEEHSKQIDRYIEKAKTFETKDGNPWSQVLAVYVKTGNESLMRQTKSAPCGIFLRDDLLAVLGQTKLTDNAIVEEFRQYLQDWSDCTQSFKEPGWVDSNDKWDGTEGLYLAIQKWLGDQDENSDADWQYVANAQGGLLCFFFHGHTFEAFRCRIYLQIDKGSRFAIRVCNVRDDDDKYIKVNGDLRWDLFEVVKRVAGRSCFDELSVSKVGRAGGYTASLAEFNFGDSGDTFLATDQANKLDMAVTQQRLALAMKFATDFCAEPAPVEIEA